MTDFGMFVSIADALSAFERMKDIAIQRQEAAVKESAEKVAADGRQGAPVLTGRLRDSITTKVEAQGETATVVAGPFGEDHVYAPKQEARYGFMAAAKAAAQGHFPAEYESQMSSGLAEFG